MIQDSLTPEERANLLRIVKEAKGPPLGQREEEDRLVELMLETLMDPVSQNDAEAGTSSETD